MSDLGDGINKLEVDVTKDASCEQAVKTIYEATGRIDIFVSNAGVSSIGSSCSDLEYITGINFYLGALLDVSIETAQRIMDTNFFGTVRLARLIGNRMALRGKGLIIPVGSTAGELPIPFKGHYNASKAALHAFTETLGEEIRPFGVTVMLCAPGTIRSNIANVTRASVRHFQLQLIPCIHRTKRKTSKAIYRKIRFTVGIRSR